VTSTTTAWARLSLPAYALLAMSGAAWVGLVIYAQGQGMGMMPGTMGLSFGGFVAVWVLMMVAMMVPTVAPFAALYTRTFLDNRTPRTVLLAAGYLAVWAAAALPAYALAALGDRLVSGRPTAATALAVGIFASCGIYQLTPLKDRCLARCRSPLGFALKYGGYVGRWRDLRVGFEHGAFCLGCCWALMAVLVAVGLMNFAAMVLLVAAVLIEKYWRWGVRFSRFLGAVALVLAVVVVFDPALAAGLHQSPAGSMSGTDTGSM
jgi:predicted metal-binding membrane protein